ncbi:hypothetical protein [Leuconostoc lactis]
MKKFIWPILLVVSGIVFGTETGLLLETMLAGPLDSNLLVTACYLLTLMVFLLSGYRTWLMWRQK